MKKRSSIRAAWWSLVLVLLMTSVVTTLPRADGSLVASQSLNGNQEVAFDAATGILCGGNPETGNVMVHDTVHSTYDLFYVGTNPISLDIAANGSILYVAVSERKAIVLIDLVQKAEIGVINLSAAPCSLREWRPDLLLFSGLYDGAVHSYNLTTRSESLLIEVGARSCLEVSPDGTDLLVFALGYDGGYFRYREEGRGFILMATATSRVISPSQMAVDWAEGTAYLASALDGGITKYNISSLSITGVIATPSSSSGLLFLRDLHLLLNVVPLINGTGVEISAYDPVEGSLLASKYCRNAGPFVWVPYWQCVIDGHNMGYTEMGPYLLDCNPSQSLVHGLGFGPSGAVISVMPGLDRPGSVAAHACLDGAEMPTDWSSYPNLRTIFPTRVADGDHTIHVRLQGMMGYAEHNYTFTVDRELGISPFASIFQPKEGYIEYGIPTDLYFEVQNLPAPVDMVIEVELNGIRQSVVADPLIPNRYHISNSSVMEGDNGGQIILSYDGQVHSFAWNFRVVLALEGEMWPAGSSYLESLPAQIAVQLTRPCPLRDLILMLDGVPITTSWQGDTNIIAEVPAELSDGVHWLSLFKESAPEAPLQSVFHLQRMVHHDYQGRFNIDLPASWTIEENVDLNGTKAAYVARGPTENGFTTNIIVQLGRDPTVRENESFLAQYMQDLVRGIRAQGMPMDFVGDPTYLSVSGHMAVRFSISSSSLQIVQMIEVVVSESHQMYWSIIYSITTGSAMWGEQAFQGVGQSLVVTEAPSVLQTSELIIYLGVVAVLVVGAAAGVWLVRRKR